jgi:hypothetical protein
MQKTNSKCLNFVFHLFIVFYVSNSFAANTEYLIITPSLFRSAADSISRVHSDYMPIEHRLTTEIITINTILDAYPNTDTQDAIRDFLLNEISLNKDLAFVLLLGDEEFIPPIYKGTVPSDDFFTSQNELTSIPQLSTGRIPVNNLKDALMVSSKIYDYMINPALGAWRSKIALIADDQHKSGSYNKAEFTHTENSDILYDSLNISLQVSTYYGIQYSPKNSNEGLLHPYLTTQLMNMINSGVAMINYIGHGSHTTLSDEKLFDMSRDMGRICAPYSICAEEKMLPIWVVGTCSFGGYDGKESMSEALLIDETGAIALVTTSRAIGEESNIDFLQNYFSLIKSSVNNPDSHVRLGSIVREAKSKGCITHTTESECENYADEYFCNWNDNVCSSKNDHLFHLFGDPALILPFPKISYDIIEESDIPVSFTILEEESINLQIEEGATINIVGGDHEFIQYFGDDSLIYSVPGDIIFQGPIDEDICFHIPLDANAGDTNVDIVIYAESTGNYGHIQFVPNIPIMPLENGFSDITGPTIKLYYHNTELSSGSELPPGASLTTVVSDELGLNLMTGYQHNIRYWLSNSDISYTLDPNLFQYNGTCNTGSIILTLPHDIQTGNLSIFVEAWDSANNRSQFEESVSIIEPTGFYAYQVYNFPNPFAESTYFTFWLSEYPANVAIDVYSPMGHKVKHLSQACESAFNTIQWDGKSDTNEDIANGPYVYNLTATSENGIFKDIYKLAKVK